MQVAARWLGRRSQGIVLAGLLSGLLAPWPQAAHAQGTAARVLITAAIDEHALVRLGGNTRPEAIPANDRGPVPDSLPLAHMQLLLKRPADREQALKSYLARLHDRTSPVFHRWLSARELGETYGVSPEDLATVVDWLRRSGFTVNGVYPSTLLIDFSGTAGAVHNAFHTEIHALSVRGVRHFANIRDPQIPAALAPLVAGIVSLHDFRPHPTLHRPRAGYTTTIEGVTVHLVAPADLATIYNLNPLFAGGVTGKNQTVTVVEDSDVYSASDWSTFRSAFGLSGYSTGSFTEVHPSGANNCADPGATGDQAEAIVDAEWASAAAPGAAIELASCANTTTTSGVFLALLNLVNEASPPPIISISYAGCEAENGVSANEAISSAYQQAVAEGVSVFVAAGDWGAAVCNAGGSTATEGISVNGLASTAYNVAVGGTDFGDTYAGSTSTYWNSTNSSVYGSALSYIPEIPWNESCAGALLSSYAGYATPYGSSGFCNSTTALNDDFIDILAGSGGPSSCAIAATSGCAGTPKPSWQAGVPGIQNDGVRDLPDVSLFAAAGPWGHAYVFCQSTSSATCSTTPASWVQGGGTSFAAPILAGIQALVNQSTGARQGNPNTVYYTLAASQSASGLGCNSTSGNAVASGCVFYDVTLGDMDVDCTGSDNCYLPSGTYGVLSTSDTTYARAFAAGTGWDFATGLGSVNAANLVKYWTSSDLSLSAAGSVTGGGLLAYALTVGDRGPQSASVVVVSTVLPAGFALVSGSSGWSCAQSGQKVSCTLAATLAVNATAQLTLTIQPGAPELVDLAFTATPGNGDLDPADGTASVSLNWTGGDVPLPAWASLTLGVLLLAALAAWRGATCGSRTCHVLR